MKHLKLLLQKLDYIIRFIIILTSLLVIAAIVVDYGFMLTNYENELIRSIYTIGWWVFFVSFTLQLLFRWSQIRKKALSLTTILGTILYISSLPHLFAAPDNYRWMSMLWAFLENKYFLIALLGMFSLVELSRAVTSFVNKRTNPALLVVLCFAITILFGALLLMLPRSTMEYIHLSIIDALFTSTSAVCVTGLSTVEVAHTFTLEGQIIIALLIQIGGLGIMTITSFFAVFFMDGLGLYSQFALKDMLSSDAESLISTLLHVLGFTLVIEFVGAVCIWLSIHPMQGMTLDEEIFFAVFHAVSAFCNAGFSTMEGNLGNEILFANYNIFYVVISVLIILGGIGFPILINLKKQLGYQCSKLLHSTLRRRSAFTRYSHLINVNTKMVLYTTLLLILGGTALIALCEWNGALADMSAGRKILHSFFNAVVPRTAGFNSVAVGDFSRLTIMLLIFLMWIGGASQSTAGGIKVNTLAVAYASIKSLVSGRRETVLFNREIPENTIRRAFVVVFCSILVITFFYVVLLILEPHMPAISLLFETISAFSTVGLSLGITYELGDMSKFTLVVLMFIGRVGLITALMSFVPRREPTKYRLPKEHVIIN